VDEIELKDIKETVGDNVRNYRTKLSWSQEKLAEKSNLHRTYIGAVERGEKNVTIVNLEKISIALGVDIKDLFETQNK